MTNTYEIVGDEALEDALLEKTLTELVDDRIKEVGTSVFTLTPNLEKVELPNVTTIGESSFLGCSKLVDVSFPNLDYMGNNALRECTSLQCLDLPKLTRFGGWGVYGSTAFKTLILRNENAVCSIANGAAFNGTLIASGTGYVYVPRALIDNYKVATHWSTYANQFRALEDYTVDGTVTGEFNLDYIGDAPIEDGLVMHYDYRGRQEDTNTTITDLVNGVTAKNFDKWGKIENGIWGGDSVGKSIYLLLDVHDDAFAAFLAAMKAGQGFTAEMFGSVSVFEFQFNGQLNGYGSVGGFSTTNREGFITNSTTPQRVLTDGTIEKTGVNMGTTVKLADVPHITDFIHVVVTYSPDGVIQRWVNGVPINTPYQIANFKEWYYDGMFTTNNSHLPSLTCTYYYGDESRYISTQRIYNRVLTESEIKNNCRYEYHQMTTGN